MLARVPPKTLIRSQSVVAAHLKNMAFVVWRARAVGESVKAVRDFVDQCIPRQDRFSIVHVVEDGVGLPTPDGREALVSLGRLGKERMVCVAVLLPATSIIATALRAFVRATVTVIRTGLPLIVEQDVRDLARSLSEMHAAGSKVRLSPTEIIEAIEATRRLGLERLDERA
jgi:hypothetical protein